VSEYRDRPVARKDVVEEYIDERRLARAVRAEKAERLTLLDGEIDPV
jgi:hypothetical protein